MTTRTTAPLLAGFAAFTVAVIVGAVAGYRWVTR